MDEISNLLKSGVWWFSLLVAFIVGILSNHFLDWIGKFIRVIGDWRLRRSRKAKRKYLKQLRFFEKFPNLWGSYLVSSKLSMILSIFLMILGFAYLLQEPTEPLSSMSVFPIA